MKKISITTERSWFTTIMASLIGLGILLASILLLPINNLVVGLTFGIGILLVVLCAVTAVKGEKGMIKDIIYSLTFWS
ncbi:MAG: hypothetical protein ACOH18_02495 [Candidatus Saccharimonadaceae bacterium]